MRPCFAFSARTEKRPAVLAIDDEIGFWGTQAKDFRAALDAVEGDELEVQINSPGGDVMAGIGMHNMLRNWAANGRTVTTRVTGVAASIASIVALAGDRRVMPKNAFAMVHSVSTGAWGTAEDLREAAEVVDKVQTSVRNIYVDRMGVDEAKAAEIMAKDTWLTADECLELGFATEVGEEIKATACFNLARAALPENVARVFSAKVDDTKVDDTKVDDTKVDDTKVDDTKVDDTKDTTTVDAIVALAKAGGLEAHAPFLALACASVDDAKTRISTAREIVALCRVAGVEAKAASFIHENKAVPDVRAALVEHLAATDKHVDTAPRASSNPGNAKPANVTSASLWDSHNKQSTKGA